MGDDGEVGREKSAAREGLGVFLCWVSRWRVYFLLPKVGRLIG